MGWELCCFPHPWPRGAADGSGGGLGRREGGGGGLDSAPTAPPTRGPASGGQQGAPEDRQCRGVGLSAPGAAGPGRDPRPRPGGAEPRGRRGRGTEETARSREPVSRSGDSRSRPSPPPGTPRRPPPTGSPVWAPAPGPSEFVPSAPTGSGKAALMRDTCVTVTVPGCGFSSYFDGTGPESATPPGGPPSTSWGVASLVPRLPAYPRPPLGSQAQAASHPPTGPHLCLLFFWAICPSPRPSLTLTHTPEPPKTPLHQNPPVRSWTPRPCLPGLDTSI